MAETPKTKNKSAKKDDYLVQGAILAAAAVLTKIIGVVYRIPLTTYWEMRGTASTDMPSRSMRSPSCCPRSVFRQPFPSLSPQGWLYAREGTPSVSFSVPLCLPLWSAWSSPWRSSFGAGALSTYAMRSPLSV